MNRKISGEAVGLHDTCKTALDERGRNIEEGTGKEIGRRRNTNARCKCGVTKLDRVRHGTKGGTESGRNRKESSREGVGTGAGIYDEKRRPLPGRRWLDRVRGYINGNGRSGRECTTQLHGHVGPISSDNDP